MAASHPTRLPRWILATPLAVLAVLPVGATDLRPQRAGNTLGPALAQLPAQAEQPIPADITALEQTAQGFYERGEYQKALEVMQKVMAWVDGNLPRLHPYRATSQTRMGVLLSKVGRRQEALAPTEEALKIYRELAKTNPAFLPDLATALNNLGIRLSELGRRQEALAPTEEALRIYRELAKTNPAFLPDLAMALNNLGVFLSELGRRQEALAPTEEAVKIRRELAKTNPAFLPDLAMALNNLGIRLSELGRRQEALAPTEEALKIYRELAKTNPAFLPDLARALTSLGFIQFQLDQPEIARNAYEESIDILRPPAASNPAFQDDLQRSLNNLENLNRAEGIRTGAQKPLAADDISFLPKDDPIAPVKRAVVRLSTTFSGNKPGAGVGGTAFVVKRQGNRAWIATALHVVRDAKDAALATKVVAEIYPGPLPTGVLPARLEVVLPPVETLKTDGEDLIVLEVRGLPPDVQTLPLITGPPTGILKVVGHPAGKPPWSVATFQVLKSTERELLLDGQLMPGASGSPVLNESGQVLGLVYEVSTLEKKDINLVFAYRSQSIQSKLPE